MGFLPIFSDRCQVGRPFRADCGSGERRVVSVSCKAFRTWSIVQDEADMVWRGARILSHGGTEVPYFRPYFVKRFPVA